MISQFNMGLQDEVSTMKELQQKEEKLLMAALHLFNEYGFHNTPTSRISKEAGVSTGTLYNYFESKEELINSLYLFIKQHSVEYIMNGFKRTEDFKEGFNRIWTLMIQWGYENPEFFKFKESFCQSPFIEHLNKERINEQFGFLERYIRDAMENGIIREIERELFLAVVQGIMVSTIKYINKYKPEDCQTIIQNTFDLLWNGICNR